MMRLADARSYNPSTRALTARLTRSTCARQMHMVLRRNNVNVSGAGSRAMMFSHGFGCDQNMWTAVARAFEADFRVVLFDHVGAGRSDLAAYQATKYARLEGYADDVVEIGRALELKDAVFVGHSVSAMIGALASLKARQPPWLVSGDGAGD